MGKGNGDGTARRSLALSCVLSAALLAALTGCALLDGEQLARSEWRAREIKGAKAIESPQSALVFSDGGRLSGNGSCNRLFGEYEAKGEELRIHSIGSTKMACAPAVMHQEAELFDALEKTRRFRRDAEGYLVLADEAGTVLARLQRTDTLKVSAEYWRPSRMLLLR